MKYNPEYIVHPDGYKLYWIGSLDGTWNYFEESKNRFIHGWVWIDENTKDYSRINNFPVRINYDTIEWYTTATGTIALYSFKEYKISFFSKKENTICKIEEEFLFLNFELLYPVNKLIELTCGNYSKFKYYPQYIRNYINTYMLYVYDHNIIT